MPWRKLYCGILAASLLAAPAAAQHKPAKPTLDKKFWLLTAATGAATVLDVEITQNCLHTEPGCRELNPIYGPRPSRARMYGTVAAENFLGAYLGYRLKKSPRRWLRRLWWVPQTVAIVGHGKGLVVTLRLTHKGGIYGLE